MIKSAIERSQLGADLVEATPRTQAPVCQLLEQDGFRMLHISERWREMVQLLQAFLPSEGTFDLLAWPAARHLHKLP